MNGHQVETPEFLSVEADQQRPVAKARNETIGGDQALEDLEEEKGGLPFETVAVSDSSITSGSIHNLRGA
jgi:hypothetical protein